MSHRQAVRLRVRPLVCERAAAQILVLYALAIIPLMAVAAIVVDGGTLYVQRRTAQNAADGAALAGSRALANAPTAADSTVATAVCKYARANSFGVTPVVSSAIYVKSDGTSTGTSILLPTGCTGTFSLTTIPNTAAGVQVTVQMGPYDTYLAGVIGVSQMTVNAAATSLVHGLTSVASGDAPVAICGPYAVSSTSGSTGSTFNILTVDNGNNVVNYGQVTGDYLILQSSMMTTIEDDNAPGGNSGCPTNNGGADWKGTISDSSPISAGQSYLVNGNSTAAVGTACTNGGQADPTGAGYPSASLPSYPPVNRASYCFLEVPTTSVPNPAGEATIVTFTCVEIGPPGSGADQWSGVIADPSYCVINPNNLYGAWSFSQGRGAYTVGITS